MFQNLKMTFFCLLCLTGMSRENKVSLDYLAALPLLLFALIAVPVSAQTNAPTKAFSVAEANTIEIERVEWEELSGKVDANPNGGKRIFPDKVSPGEDWNAIVPRNRIRVRAWVKNAPVNAKIYFQGFDVDDPSINNQVDIPNKKIVNNVEVPISHIADDSDSDDGGDNKESNGDFKNGTNDWSIKEVPVVNGTAEYEYTVTMRPGDNFRVAASASDAAIKELTVIKNSAGIFVPVSDLAGSFKGRLTELLTVWRRLHIEADSMRQPINNENKVVGGITDIDPVPSGGMILTVRIIGAAGANENLVNSVSYIKGYQFGTTLSEDKSPNLDGWENGSKVGNGRFENGSVRLGPEVGGVVVNNLKGNGHSTIHLTTKVDILFSLSAPNKPTITGKINNWSAEQNSTFIGVDKDIPLDYSGYEYGQNNTTGAKVSILGKTYDVMANTANSLILASHEEIEFLLSDDDQLNHNIAGTSTSLLPYLPVIKDKVKAMFAHVFIEPDADGGGNMANNSLDVEFMRNVDMTRRISKLDKGFQSKSQRAPDFWIVNLVSVYQSQMYDDSARNRADIDPALTIDHNKDGVLDTDGGGLAFAALGGSTAVMCREDYREIMPINLSDENYQQEVWVHEMGHLFNLPDRYTGDSQWFGWGKGGIMENNKGKFINRDAARIRNISMPGALEP